MSNGMEEYPKCWTAQRKANGNRYRAAWHFKVTLGSHPLELACCICTG